MTLQVLHVLDHSLPLQSGYTFRTLALLREQHALGWQTFHLTSPKHYASGMLEEEEVGGLHFFRTPVRSRALARVPVVDNAMVIRATAARIDQLIQRLRPDIIHAHSPCLNGLAALKAGRARGVPVVYEMRASWEDAAVDHGTTREGSLRYRLSRSLETRVLRRADAVTTICQGLAADIRSRGVPDERITVIPNAVDIEDFEPIECPDEALRTSLGLGRGPVIGFIGSFYGYEGLEWLIRALPRIAQVHPDATALLVGGGPAEAQLRAVAGSLGMESRVRFAGRVPHGEVRRYYSVIDVLAYPRTSIRLTELVTPLKPLESMSLGRVFIASDVGGHREVLPAHLHPYLFRPSDSADLGRAVLQLLAVRGEWPALTAASRRYVCEQRTWRQSAAGYRGVYAACAAARRAA